ncbi:MULTISPECIES: hypothetical protein [unclassified Mesorhizobium]|uniref:hypothetical protein n=1 Tax=unclassified Mesorhizobium TaxID=325217 RepID=UPI001FE21AC0|nr:MULTISPECIES: hypothetical protein [unclassified Mesorhizobium]
MKLTEPPPATVSTRSAANSFSVSAASFRVLIFMELMVAAYSLNVNFGDAAKTCVTPDG